MARRLNFQTLSWFYDLFQRKLLDLDPPYQRRSVWNQSFKDYFVDTVLLGYPSPAIFLFETITEDGRSLYHVVDGKQRLTTLFEFVTDKFPTSEKCALSQLSGEYFSGLDPELKKAVWGYQFLVEYVPSDNTAIIDAIFDRLNRNVAKLSAQELRHARFDGVFINACEQQAEALATELPPTFPRIAPQSRRQMKDVEMVSLILLLLEEGPKGYSQADLDKAFSDRDDEWEARHIVEAQFRAVIAYLNEIAALPGSEEAISSRLRNQADFYSLFGAIADLLKERKLPPPKTALKRLATFIKKVDNVELRELDPRLAEYYEAARSASNDKGPRETRIKTIKDVLLEVWK
jgi:hypothetical protein